MQSYQRLLVTYVICITVSLGTACDAGEGAGSGVHGGAGQLEILDDGTALVGESSYESMISYHQSPAFRGQGRRCATPEPPISAFFLPSDCGMHSTSVMPQYDPIEVYDLPVVFHLIERSDGYGHVPDELVLSQLDILNEDFQAMPNTPGAPGMDSRIRFVLATVDPQGRPTTGITRHIDDAYFYDPGPQRENRMKQALAWDPTRYFNIYSNNGGGGGTLGYATFPQLSAGAMEDGVVLNWAHLGRNAPHGGNYNQGRTATHEVGHYLGLFHTFQDGCGTPSHPYASGDRIADTVPEPEPQFGCTPVPSSCPDVAGNSPIDNYMNYTDDICMSRFTTEQINRMRCVLFQYRSRLYNPLGTPKAAFTAVVSGLDAVFVDGSSDVGGELVSWSWTLGDGTSSSEQQLAHVYPGGGAYSVSLTVTDNEGNSATSTQTVVLNEPPQASFTHRIDYTAGALTVRFTDHSTDADGSIRDRIWIFGDGTSSTEVHPSHTFAGPGTYTVELTVIDDAGAAGTTTAVITAQAVASAPDTSAEQTSPAAGTQTQPHQELPPEGDDEPVSDPVLDLDPGQVQDWGGCAIGRASASNGSWPNGLGTMLGLLASLLLVSRRKRWS